MTEEHRWIDCIVADIRGEELDCLVIVTQIADRLHIPMAYLRDRKGHGTDKDIEGTTIKELSKLKNVYVLKRFKYEVTDGNSSQA